MKILRVAIFLTKKNGATCFTPTRKRRDPEGSVFVGYFGAIER